MILHLLVVAEGEVLLQLLWLLLVVEEGEVLLELLRVELAGQQLREAVQEQGEPVDVVETKKTQTCL